MVAAASRSVADVRPNRADRPDQSDRGGKAAAAASLNAGAGRRARPPPGSRPPPRCGSSITSRNSDAGLRARRAARGRAGDVAALEQLAAHFRKASIGSAFDRLWQLAHPPHVHHARHGLDLQRYQRRGIWQRAAGADGQRLADEAADHYEQCADAFRELIGKIATAIISIFSVELDGLLHSEKLQAQRRGP